LRALLPYCKKQFLLNHLLGKNILVKYKEFFYLLSFLYSKILNKNKTKLLGKIYKIFRRKLHKISEKVAFIL
jgi:hypothetical protein